MNSEVTSEVQVKKRQMVREEITAALFSADVIAMALSFILAWFTAPFIKDLIAPNIYARPFSEYRHMHDLFFVWMCPLVLFLFYTRGHYTHRVPWWSQVQHVLSVCVMAYIFDGFVRFALDMSFSRLLIGLSWLYVFFLALAGRYVVFKIYSKKKLWNLPVLVIGDIETVTNTLYAFAADTYTGYDVHAVYLRDNKNKPFDLSSLPQRYKNLSVHREVFEYRDLISKNLDSFFVIALETFRGQDRDHMINMLERFNALYAIVPPMSRMSLFDMEPRYFFGHDIMLLHAKSSLFSPMGQLMKRTMDVFVSGIALIFLSPIMLLVGLCLKLEGQGGSVFYGGYRIGRYGQRFKCWKFRSMEPDSDHLLHELLECDPEAKADWEKYRKLKQPDPRITTKTARIIRKTSIDELPQLWNVFNGDMSLVGPRPILLDEVELFGDSFNEYLRVRPGITGLWQVSGRNDTSFQRRIYWDSWYVRNWSIWGDIVILFKTLKVVLGRSGAY